MKKTVFSIFSFLMAAVLCCGCGSAEIPNTSSAPQKPDTADPAAEKLIGVWVAYYELPFLGKSEAEFQMYVSDMFSSIARLGANAVFCHVRSYCDAIYPSDILPWSNAEDRATPQGTDPGYDPLKILIEEAENHKLQFHAWINPYRVATSVGTDRPVYQVLAEDHPVRRWMTDGDTSNDNRALVYTTKSGGTVYNNISLNPAEPAVTKLIVDGVREILDRYDVDGIHFDDYFYPTDSADFDSASYTAYTQNGGHLSLGDWRRANVNAMINAVYAACKGYGKIFGISPAANISDDNSDRNYTHLFADVRLWAKTAGYADYIMPQLYFGYDYPLDEYKYSNLLAQWAAIEKHPRLKLYIGLAAYKIGAEDAGSDEWQTDTDIIANEAADAFAVADGIVLFSYGSTVSEDNLNQQQIRNFKSVLGKG